MALICVEFTNTGIASTETLPCVIFIDTPLRVVANGNAAALTPVAGPSRDPNTVNKDPRAMDPPGSPGVVRLDAAFTVPFGVIKGCAVAAPADTSSAHKTCTEFLFCKSTSSDRKSEYTATLQYTSTLDDYPSECRSPHNFAD